MKHRVDLKILHDVLNLLLRVNRNIPVRLREKFLNV